MRTCKEGEVSTLGMGPHQVKSALTLDRGHDRKAEDDGSENSRGASDRGKICRGDACARGGSTLTFKNNLGCGAGLTVNPPSMI